jgi:hypothetical protein
MLAYEPIYVANIEKGFRQAVIDLKRVIVLDGIDIPRENSRFRIRCHDLNGPLPELVIYKAENGTEVLDRVRNRACWLYAIARIRADLQRYLAGSRFLFSTTIEGKAVVGLRAGPLTFLEDGEDFLAAYHKLRGRIIGGGVLEAEGDAEN